MHWLPAGMTSSEWTTIIATMASAATGIIATLMTLLFTKGVNALIQLRASNRIDDVRKEARDDEGKQAIIDRQDKRIEALEALLVDREHDHEKCIEQYNQLREEFLSMKFRLDAMERRERTRIAKGEGGLSDPNLTIKVDPPEAK
jgi:hypothetical protein